MDFEKNKERFLKELEVVKRPGMDKLLEYINKYDMFTAPSSTRYHLSVPGGLLQHSLNVLDALRSILHDNGDGTYSYIIAGVEIAKVTEENIVIMALLHDICKTNFYKQTLKHRKNREGQWEDYYGYEIDDRIPYGHGEKSVLMIETYIRLEPVERYAIRWHMGFPEGNDKYTFGSAVEMYPIIWALHTADMLAAHCMEGEEGNKQGF